MFDPGAGTIYRSIRRTQRFAGVGSPQRRRRLRSREAPAGPASRLEVNRTMRPYHLGWILEAWAGREELATQ